MELSIVDIVLFIVAITLAVWFYFQYSYRYWEKRQVPYLKPIFPYGNSTTLLLKDSLPAGEVHDWYNELKKKGHQFGGVWSFSRPVFVVLDPEYIKDILTKDFHNFVNREIYCNEKHDPLGTNLFNIEEHNWKLLRQKLTPTFTSGKMKIMFNSVVHCSDNMIEFLKKKVDANEDIDIREVLASFTSDVIGNVAFGVESNSFDDSKNDIRKYGKEIFETFDISLLLRIALQRICPNISKKLGIKSMPDRMTEFFSNLVKSTMEYRTKNNVTRPDFLQLLIDMHQEGETSEKYVNFDQIVANTLLFFIAGNNNVIFLKSTAFASEAKDWYDAFKKQGHKFGGVWSFSRKVLVLVDPEYIKDVLTKDFHYFIDRDVFSNEKYDPKGTHLFNISESGWKPLRQKLTPTFTSGKMKMMFNSVLKCSNSMVDFMNRSASAGLDIDIREVLASFTTDVISSVAFGVESNSFDDSLNDIRRHGRTIFQNVNLQTTLRILLSRSFPELAKKVATKGMRQDTQDFFEMLVKSTIDYRRQNNVTRPDFLQLLMDMNQEPKNSEKYVNFDQIVANTVLFFIAGFDTSSTTMTFTLYELARNQELQEKTRTEIVNVLNKYDGQITYDSLREMVYLQQAVDEALRIWPPLVSLGRICTKDYTLRDTDITIAKSTAVVISTLGLGRDPEYFPDPEKFDPERFSSENKAKLHPYVHLPFGEGPRNCIGLRFGLMQSKIGIIRVLSNFRLTISPKTKMPLTVDPTFFLLKSNETLYLRAEKLLK